MEVLNAVADVVHEAFVLQQVLKLIHASVSIWHCRLCNFLLKMYQWGRGNEEPRNRHTETRGADERGRGTCRGGRKLTDD
uniref:Uncharacterized protein n=1 Tax=Hyaloperonospora arabidopsidis (strain Emoy2) TaxID=559515 RepID=M4BE98_HYAAE